MTPEEAIKYLQQLYPNGGHCWLDDQRIEAISMAIKALQKESASEDFKIALEEKVRKAQHWTYIEEEGCECPIYMEFGADDLEDFAKWGAEWQKQKDANLIFNAKEDGYRLGFATMKQQMMKNAVEVPIEEAVPFGSCKWKLCAKLWLDKGVKGNKVKLVIIKDE